MLRPERMSKVSVTGSKSVMDDVVEAVYDLNLLHLSRYDGEWEGFDSGNPMEGAEEASEKLVTIRSLKSILDVSPEDAGPQQVVTEESIETELERVREQANELDDRREELESELRSIEERLDAMDPFVSLGIDLDLLRGYDSLEVSVGRGREDAIRSVLEDAAGVDAFEVYTGDDGRTLGVFAHPADDAENVLEDVLVGADFEAYEIPEGEGDPTENVENLRHRKRQVTSELATVEDEIEDLRLDAAGFLLAAEERLTIDVQKEEAPLQFATTKNAFVAEGWIPTERYEDLQGALEQAVGDHVEVEEIERARYTEDGHPEEREPVGEPGEPGGAGDPAAAADGGKARTDGGQTAVIDDDPPVILDNPKAIAPIELLVETAERPRYTEFDPTVLVFLTFPAFFGFMIGDLGYGILYTAIGYLLYKNADGDALSSLGGIAMWAGVFTALFGVLYGEFFGLHQLGEIVWGGHPPIHKGLQPHYSAYATGWMLASLTVGLLHVGVGHALGFVKTTYNHDLKDAVFENGSWILLMFGFWTWVFSKHLQSSKPQFIYEVFNREGAVVTTPEGPVTLHAEDVALSLGFGGLPETVGLAALAATGLGFVMLIIGEGAKAIEFLQAIVNVLSYVRLMAVLLAKAGMAFVVNLLVFGAYEHHGEFHFLFFSDTYASPGEVPAEELMFGGLLNASGGVEAVVGLLAGILLLVIGHLFVLALGVTSAGLQAVRLEYVEFFGKFYDGGGRTYDPFGYTRKYTTED